ncbi:MAG: hypothetical protein ABEH66_01640 [Halobacteriales archaeon]
MRRVVCAIALAVLVALAGCSGGPLPGVGGEGSTPGDTTDPGEAAEPDEESGPTPDLSEVDDPAGASAEGITNVSALLEAHVAELRTLSSYRLVILEAGENQSNRIELRFDVEGEEYVGTRDGWERDAELYFRNGTQYRLVVPDDEVQTNEVTFDRATGAGAGLLRVLGDVTTTRENVTTVEGVSVVTYRITGTTSDAESIETASGIVQITPDGLIARLAISVTTSEGPGRLAYAIHDRNETSVSTPAWFAERDLPKTTAEAPQLSLGLNVRDDGRVELTHEGGDPVGSLEVRYTTDGESVVETWDPEDGEILTGASYVTGNDPDPGTTIRVVWSSGDRSLTLLKSDVPE